MGKMKVYELAKKLNKASKDIIAVAEKLGIEVKNHLSSLEDEAIEKIEKNINVGENKVKKVEQKKEKTEKNESPVIIRRQVIISDEEIKKF